VGGRCTVPVAHQLVTQVVREAAYGRHRHVVW
jgi:hypothetical protein